MKLIDTLKALSVNENLNVTIADDDANLITFNAKGYESIEADLGNREVKRIKVASGSSLTVELSDVTPTVIPVTGVTIDKSTATISVNGTETLTATIAPSNATNKAVTWSSDAEGVATVENGVVTGVSAGSANITVTTADGGFTATCAVTVEY